MNSSGTYCIFIYYYTHFRRVLLLWFVYCGISACIALTVILVKACMRVKSMCEDTYPYIYIFAKTALRILHHNKVQPPVLFQQCTMFPARYLGYRPRHSVRQFQLYLNSRNGLLFCVGELSGTVVHSATHPTISILHSS
jgi:hypothetical protein